MSWLLDVSGTSGIFSAEADKTYAFYSLARDLVGNIENAKTLAEATAGIVASDSTPPVIRPLVTATLGTNGWFASAANISWSVTDPESAISSTAGCDPVVVTADTAAVTFTCQGDQRGGGAASQSTTIKIDRTAPTLAFSAPSPAPNENGWNRTDVTLSFATADSTSGVASTSLASPLMVTGTGTGWAAA